MTHVGEVGIEIAPEVAGDPALAARLDDLLHRTCQIRTASGSMACTWTPATSCG
jgi:hypothetical protein